MFDISIVSAFLAGLLSFVSPCILPIVPFYLSYLAGVGMNQISSDSEIDSATRRRAVLAAMFFAAGVITIFMGDDLYGNGPTGNDEDDDLYGA